MKSGAFTPTTSQEYYRYARQGVRLLKSSGQMLKTGVRCNQVRYLPGLEIRTVRNSLRETENLKAVTISGVRILRWQQGRPAAVTNKQIRFSATDHIESLQLELDDSGKIISREQYYPFGGTAIWVTRNQTESRYKTVRYSGKERDVTGLVYYGYRYYAPWLMRWVNTDPAATVDGLNLFSMVRNNPSTLLDRDGQISSDSEAEDSGKRLLRTAKRLAENSEPASKKTIGQLYKELGLESSDDEASGRQEVIRSVLADLESQSESDEPAAALFHCTHSGCSYRSAKEKYLKEHVRRVHSGRVHHCTGEGCNRIYSSWGALRIHFRKHHLDSRVQCNIQGCNKIFADRSLLSSHRRTHTLPFACSEAGCDSRFAQRHQLNTHQRMHFALKPFQCKFPGCRKSFSAPQNLSTHMKTHQNESLTFPCREGCGGFFSQRSKEEDHYQAVHLQHKRFECPHCHGEFSYIQGLQRHLKNNVCNYK